SATHRFTIEIGGDHRTESGQGMLDPDGKIDVGAFGVVSVRGMTVEQAQSAISKQVVQGLDRHDSRSSVQEPVPATARSAISNADKIPCYRGSSDNTTSTASPVANSSPITSP